MDRRFAWMVCLLGLLLAGTGFVGVAKGDNKAMAPGGTLGIALVVTGLWMTRRDRRALAVAIALTMLSAVAMAVRMHGTGLLLPYLPVGVLAVALSFALTSERRRATRGFRR